MSQYKLLIFLSIIICTLFLIPVSPGYTSQSFTSPHPLPHVSPGMEKPEFWIKKIRNPSHLLLKPDVIEKMNETVLKRKDLYLFYLNDLQEELSKEELLAYLKEDWEAFVKPGETRYGREGKPHGNSFWLDLNDNLNQGSLKENNKLRFGLVTKRADIRVFPTKERSTVTPGQEAFDRFQHSSITPGSLTGIYHTSRDNRWTYVQSQFTRGWVSSTAVGITDERRDALEYQVAKERLVITGSFVKVFGDPAFQQVAFVAQMGDSFPLLGRPLREGATGPWYSIKIPLRDNDGKLRFGMGYLPATADVHEGFLPYTQEGLSRQAFKMLHQPYGWGDMFEARDCSRFIMDLFASFGIIMPRNSMFQGKVGKNLGEIESKKITERKRVLDRAVPLATVLRLPGHIMLYLGKDRGRYYVIHNIWGIQNRKIGRVEVSDLSLGESGHQDSLLQRITDVRFIGTDTDNNFP